MGKKKAHPNRPHSKKEYQIVSDFGHELFHEIMDEVKDSGLCGDLTAKAMETLVSELIVNGYLNISAQDPALAVKWISMVMARASEMLKQEGHALTVNVFGRTP